MGTEKPRRTIWIFNHYATLMLKNKSGRHYSLAKELSHRGYKVVIFCASTIHNSDESFAVEGRYRVEQLDGVDYVIAKCRPYAGNGLNRIFNMLDYYRGLLNCAHEFSKPDVVIGSSVHPLAQRAALKISDRLGCKNIIETRDLWPESLVEYGYLNGASLLAKALYANERRTYERADALVFTMEGGLQYIRDKGWDIEGGGKVDLSKVFHINNGIDLDAFKENLANRRNVLPQLEEGEAAKIVYAGSLRKANNLSYLIDVAEQMQDDNVEFFAIGGGDELDTLRAEVQKRGLQNIDFPGPIDKRDIPSALQNALLLLLYSQSQTSLSRYGMSQNKLFDYLASGKPILSNLPSSYSIINQYNCGLEKQFEGPEDFAQTIRDMISDQEAMKQWGENAGRAAELYSFERHADRLVRIIEDLVREEEK